MVFRVIACFLILAFCANSSWADEILGCGGFVEASSSLIKLRKSSDAKLDYSHITVELRTVDGLLKDWTQCAPNGYYFIPVYDKGSFVLKIKGPEGWSWHPDNVPVIIDNFGCNANQDINFQFTGFTISGRILGAVGGESCSLKDAGPSGVKVELLSLEGDVISSAISSPVGKYSFTNIIPGKYQLHGSHPNLKIEVRGSPEIDLGFGNELVNDIFFIPGYDIHGSVVAQDNPILGVQVFLYSEDVSEVHCPRTFAESLEQKNSLCHAVSDADGKFSFHLIPCGVYKLLPYYKGENTVFDISPPSMTVSVEQNHVTVLQKFQVTGFSVGGRVVDDNGVGVVGAKVIVDGQERAITDSHGYYKLDQVTSRHYSIGAEKAHYKFKSLQKFLVLPNMDLIADIEATHYDICGFVRLVHSDARVKVALTHGPENIKPQVKWADVDGNFCFEVPPGEYRLSAFASSQETASGLLFLPDYIDVAVHSPILDIEFSQALVDIRGMVLCKEKCGSTVHVSLTRLSSRSTEKPRTITLSDEGAEFSFSKVVPGKHRLEVKHEASPEQDNWCWEQSSIDFDVGTEDRKGITFVQKGYWINIFSTHDVDARIQQPDSSFFDLHIKKGSQKICVESYGKYELQFVNSCLFFGGESVKFHSSNPSPIYLTATKYLIKGEIHIDPGFNLSSLSDGIIVDVLNGENSVVDSIHTRYVSEGNQGEVAVFEYSFWANNGDDLIFAPQDLREVKENRILFYPKQKHVSVMDYGCQASVSPFVGRVGLYVSGSVSPAVSDVQIRIIAATESKNTPLKKGELAFETITDSDGIFVGGPLYDDASYIVEASKPGYHLKPSGKNSFICQKLGQISVHLYSSEELPFPSVLLSLSGENGYRNNSVTGVGGFFIFDSLFPGSYYLRPLLKEYSFSPSTQAIELGSGEAKEIVFHATRVAYSAMGTVSLLAGQSKEGIVVEARSEAKGYYEQTTTDSLGNYRLRGLLPDTTYVIKVASREDSGSIRLERASPESISVQVALGDIKELDFVVFEQPEITILTGHVEGNELLELQPHLSVEIMAVNDPSNVKVVIPLPLSYYFQVRGLSKAKHLVQLRSSLPSSNQKFESEAIEVDLEKQPQIHIGPLTFKTRECHQKADLTPAPVLPLIVGVSVITLFVAMPRLKDVYQSVISSPLGSTTSSSKKETIRKPILRKRTY